jgi:hypothetical protein
VTGAKSVKPGLTLSQKSIALRTVEQAAEPGALLLQKPNSDCTAAKSVLSPCALSSLAHDVTTASKSLPI